MILLYGIGFSELIILLIIVIILLLIMRFFGRKKKNTNSDKNIIIQNSLTNHSSHDNITKLEKLMELKKAGALTDEEFNNEKSKILNL